MKFILLQGIAEGNRFFTSYVEGQDHTKLEDGTVAYHIIGHAETVAEAQTKLYGYCFHMNLPSTVAIESLVDSRAFSPNYITFCKSLPRPRNLVKIHQAKLGRQSTTIQGSAHRLWVWVHPTWTVFVGNNKGICFEVPKGTTPEQAWAAWNDYKRLIAG